MRYLRTQTLNKRAIFDRSLFISADTSLTIQNTNNVLLPVGKTADRPIVPTNGMIRYNSELTPDGELEVYQAGKWRSIKYKESSQIVQQRLGYGDNQNYYFGPLNPAPPSITASGSTWGGQNLIVLVENVFQLHEDNYTVVNIPAGTTITHTETYNPTVSETTNPGISTLHFNNSVECGSGGGSGATVTLNFKTAETAIPFAVGDTIIASGFTPVSHNGEYTVTAATTTSVSFSSTNVALIDYFGFVTSSTAVYPYEDITGATVTVGTAFMNGFVGSFKTNSAGVLTSIDVVDAVGVKNVSTEEIRSNTKVQIYHEPESLTPGYYLKFGSPIPTGKPVTVLHGFDQ